MSRTYRRAPWKRSQNSPLRSFRQTGIESHDGYMQRSRERKCYLTSSEDDVWKGVLEDKWAFDVGRIKKRRD